MATRMLLSHNFTLSPEQARPLSRADFANVFITGLAPHSDIHCSPIENPHWIVAIAFDQRRSPTEVAELCAQCLGRYRAERPESPNSYTIMLLGGVKTTPATSPAPTALQPGEWGVDVVETVAPEEFLAAIRWDAMIEGKASEQIFKVTQAV